MPDPQKVWEVGEAGLLERIARNVPGWGTSGLGDDAAYVEIGGQTVLVATDFIAENVDFEMAWMPPEAIGWKALAVNASDIAAMGGRPSHAVASIGLDRNMDLSVFDGILDGLVRAGERLGVRLSGGDLGETERLVVSVTVLGEPPPTGPVRRDGARPGDAICVTGTLGAAAQGLRELMADPGATGEATDRQRYPRARVEAGRVLAAGGATAMIDISDGLAVDLWRVMRASGTGCTIDIASLPIDPFVPDEGAVELAACGGEDYELLVTLPEQSFYAVRTELEQTRTGLSRIGTVTDGDRLFGDEPLEEWRNRAWEHLRSP